MIRTLEASVPVTLDDPADFAEWRMRSRALLVDGVHPDAVCWGDGRQPAADLFSGADDRGARRRQRGAASGSDSDQIRVSRRFVDLAQSAILHSSPARFDLLYRLLWRLQVEPGLIHDAADPDMRRLDELVRAVRRDIHKMRAFVRFHERCDAAGNTAYVAWFEPQHHILRANARFFVNRFAAMRWTILTPLGSIDWDGAVLREGPPATRADAPVGDPVEDLWKTYYASTFNPARLKVGAMLREMPKRYWRNLPEAGLIPDLIAGAQARTATMLRHGAAPDEPPPTDLGSLARQVQSCTRCAIGCGASRGIVGEGPAPARLMIVDDQPDAAAAQGGQALAGQALVGPAGDWLRAQLCDVGIDPAACFITSAVRHFKFADDDGVQRRLAATAGEIDACRWWLESEIALVRPAVILALGTGAARGVLGRTVSLERARGRPHDPGNGRELWVTAHPARALRLEPQQRSIQLARLAADLALVARRIAG